MKSFQTLSFINIQIYPHELSTEPKFLLSPDMGVFLTLCIRGYVM